MMKNRFLQTFLSILGLLVLYSSGIAQINLTVPDVTELRGATVEVPVNVTGLALGDSAISYQLTIWFDSDIVQAVGATSEGTMTAPWGDPYVGPKTDTVRVGGFTTNQPGKRMVTDAGILVKLQFLVVGDPGSTTEIKFLDKKIFDTQGEIGQVTTTDGSLTAQAEPTTITVDVTLNDGWNIVSFPVVPLTDTLPGVLDGQQVTQIFSVFSGESPKTWASSRPHWANSLKSLDGIRGYEMKYESQTPGLWQITGNLIDVSTPIALYSGWSLISYLPLPADSISHAFESLGSRFKALMTLEIGSVKTWASDRPDWANSLRIVQSTFGYWIKLDSSRTLVYPSSGYLVPEPSRELTLASSKRNLQSVMIPTWCDFWAHQPDILFEGDTIQVYDQNGILCGDTLVVAQGGFIVSVFGDDADTGDIDEGPLQGEEVQFMINGDSAYVVGASLSNDSTIILGEKAIWEYRASKRVQLQLTPPTLTKSCDFWALQPDVLVEGDTVRVYDGSGVLCGDTLVDAGGAFTVTVMGDDPDTFMIDEGAIEGEELIFIINGDTAIVVGTSATHDSVIVVDAAATWENQGRKRVQLQLPQVDQKRECEFWALQPDILLEGDSVRVYDQTGVLCGETVVDSSGAFTVTVMGDDTSTTEIDEGAMQGEELVFTINGDTAIVVGASANHDSTIVADSTATWENQGKKRVQLQLKSTDPSNILEKHRPHEFNLMQNRPNPFNAQTVITYRLSDPSEINLHIFDSRGRLVRNLGVNKRQASGLHHVVWDGKDSNGSSVSSGIYICRLQSGKVNKSIKMLLLY